MNSFTDPVEEPMRQERGFPIDTDDVSANEDAPLDEDANDDAVDSAEADRRAAEEGTIGDDDRT